MKYVIIFLACPLLFLACQEEIPAPPPSNQLSIFAQNLLNAHNDWRAQVNVEKLVWDESLAEKAHELLDLEACVLLANVEELGQNGGYSAMDATEREVVNIWASAGPAYDYAADTCLILPDACNTYKQIVWANSKRLGCAKSICLDGTSTMWLCLYDPKGNVPGERPY